jgi:hypothetical protein
LGGGTPTPNKNVNKTSGKVYIIHTFAMESPSFSSPLVDEENRKIGTSLYICVCEYINSP